MLVLSRRIGEELVIDGNIRVMVVAVKGNTVRLGIAAPPIVHVVRSELVGKPRPAVAVPVGAESGAVTDASVSPRLPVMHRPRRLHQLNDLRVRGA
jgi:carbon storage regulator